MNDENYIIKKAKQEEMIWWMEHTTLVIKNLGESGGTIDKLNKIKNEHIEEIKNIVI